MLSAEGNFKFQLLYNVLKKITPNTPSHSLILLLEIMHCAHPTYLPVIVKTKSKIKQDYTLPACQAVEYTLQGILCMCRAFLPTGGLKKSSPLPSLRSSSDTGNYKAGKRKIITNFSKKKKEFLSTHEALRGLNVFVSFRSYWNLQECCKSHFNR